MATVSWIGVFPFPQVGEALIKPQQVSLWLKTFSCEQTLLRTIYSGVFQNGNFSTLSARSMREFLSDIHYKNLIELLEVKRRKVCGLDLPGAFDSQTYPH